MKQQVHLDRNDYRKLLKKCHIKRSNYRAIVLDCGVAGMIHYFSTDHHIYYEDYFYTNEEVLAQRHLGNESDLHAEVFLKFAFSNLFYIHN